MKRILLLLIFVLLLSGCVKEGKNYYVIANTPFSLEVQGVNSVPLFIGTEVTVLEKGKDFCKVKLVELGNEGYIPCEAIID